jgi:hypothetical protein
MTNKTIKVSRFGRRMTIAISALLECRTVEEAAQVAQIPASTLRRWRSRPEFASQLCTAQTEILQGTVNKLREAGVDAAVALGEIARDKSAKTPSRVRACVAIISLLLRAHEAEVIETRLTRLEAHARRAEKTR